MLSIADVEYEVVARETLFSLLALPRRILPEHASNLILAVSAERAFGVV